MQIRSIKGVDVQGKRVLLRVDFNVPLSGKAITDDTRIRSALPTITDLRDRGARIILVSHLGRPKGKVDEAYTLAPVGARLGELLGGTVTVAEDVVGPDATARAEALGDGEVLLLENVRFEAGEEKNDEALAMKLASLADIYVNDAFGAAHRAHASTVGVAHILPAYAGYLMERELAALGGLLTEPERPYIAILGGAKVSDKLGVISNLLDRVDGLIVGGGMANTFLLAEGIGIGKSLAEPDLAGTAQDLLAKARGKGVQVVLPIDAVVSTSIDGDGHRVGIAKIDGQESIFDIGPKTVEGYEELIASAKTIFWNGPMGVFERAPFAAGTMAIAQAVANSGAFSVVGGGDSVAAIEQAGLADRISHISTGGGASLEFIEGRDLPGVTPLLEKGQGS